jgi:hypothetical protein
MLGGFVLAAYLFITDQTTEIDAIRIQAVRLLFDATVLAGGCSALRKPYPMGTWRGSPRDHGALCPLPCRES